MKGAISSVSQALAPAIHRSGKNIQKINKIDS
jgi:hypothetical protein